MIIRFFSVYVNEYSPQRRLSGAISESFFILNTDSVARSVINRREREASNE
jgi:hypothetical protein